MGATSVPSAQTLLSTQYPPLAYGGHPLGLAGAQYAQNPLPGTIPVQQLLLPHFAPYTAQSSTYPFFVPPQVLPPSGIPLPSAPSHGYTDPRAMASSGVMVDPEDPSGATYSAYVALIQPTQFPSVVLLDTLLARMGDLERAQRSLQGGDRQPY